MDTDPYHLSCHGTVAHERLQPSCTPTAWGNVGEDGKATGPHNSPPRGAGRREPSAGSPGRAPCAAWMAECSDGQGPRLTTPPTGPHDTPPIAAQHGSARARGVVVGVGGVGVVGAWGTTPTGAAVCAPRSQPKPHPIPWGGVWAWWSPEEGLTLHLAKPHPFPIACGWRRPAPAGGVATVCACVCPPRGGCAAAPPTPAMGGVCTRGRPCAGAAAAAAARTLPRHGAAAASAVAVAVNFAGGGAARREGPSVMRTPTAELRGASAAATAGDDANNAAAVAAAGHGRRPCPTATTAIPATTAVPRPAAAACRGRRMRRQSLRWERR